MVGSSPVGVGDDDDVGGRRRRRPARRRTSTRCSGSPRRRRSARPRPRRRGRRRCPTARRHVSLARTIGTGSATGTSSTGATGAPTAGSDSACSSTIGTCGTLTDGRAVGDRARRARRCRRRTARAVSSGRGVRKRSNAASPGSQIVSAPSRRAIGATAASSADPTWKRSSRAYEQVHRRRRAEGQQVAGHERAVGQRRAAADRRCTPSVKAPNSAPGSCSTRYPAGSSSRAAAAVGPRRRGLLVTLQRRVDEAVTGEHRQVAEGDERRPRRRARSGARRPAPDGVDERRRAEAQPDRQQRQGPGARAQRQRQPVLTVAAERLGDRRRIDERVDADGEHHADERQGDGEAARREAHDRQADEGRRSRARNPQTIGSSSVM